MQKHDKYEIEVRVNFRYGHRLLHPYEGRCNNIHGEGGTLILIFETDKLDKNDMVFDFGEVKKLIKKLVDDNLDHAYIFKTGDKYGNLFKEDGLKTFEMSNQPTAENIAKFIYDLIYLFYPQIKRVGSIESFEDSIAWYERNKNIIDVLNFNPFISEEIKYMEAVKNEKKEEDKG